MVVTLAGALKRKAHRVHYSTNGITEVREHSVVTVLMT